MIATPGSTDKAAFRLPFMFIGTGIILFFLFQLLSAGTFASWLREYPRGPSGWMHVHFLMLGWATMTAMGAIYQLINVVLQTSLYSRKIGYAHYALFTVGALGLIVGFARTNFTWIAVFASLTFAGILLFITNIALTLHKAKLWNTVTISTTCAVSYLTLAALTGMLMGIDFYFNLFGVFHERLFHAHLWFATVGWFAILITGYGYKLMPMFYLSHGYPARKEIWILSLLNAAVLTGAGFGLAGLAKVGAMIGLLLFTVAIAIFSWHARNIKKKKHKPNPGYGIKFSVYLIDGLLATLIAAFVLFLLFPHLAGKAETLWTIGWLYLWGFVVLTILSYLSKIAPFLWWTYKYGPLIGKQKTPLLNDLIKDRMVKYGLFAIVGALVVLIAGTITQIGWLLSIGGVLVALCSIFYMIQISLVFTR